MKQPLAVSVEIDASLYSVEAVEAAAYAFTGRAHVRLSRADPGGPIRVALRSKNAADLLLEDDFFNELLHQTIRLRVSAANQRVREYIVARALLSGQPDQPVDCAQCEAEPVQPPAPPLDPALEKEIEDLLTVIEKEGTPDPLGVSLPWEAKFGSVKKEGGDGPSS